MAQLGKILFRMTKSLLSAMVTKGMRYSWTAVVGHAFMLDLEFIIIKSVTFTVTICLWVVLFFITEKTEYEGVITTESLL